MTHYVVRTGRIIDAPIETVWSLVADARGYKSWAAMTATTLEREGDLEPDGVGAIRNFGVGTVLSREEVVVFDAPHHLGYVLLSGLPIENYRADVTLTSLGDRRTRLMWIGTFESNGLVGAIMKRFLTFVLGDFVRRLSKVAPRR